MTSRATCQIRAIITDIEGTTTDISFVSQVLFPYAAKALPAFLAQHQADPAVAIELDAVRTLMQRDTASVAEITEQLLAWIRADQKITPLKALQGMIWRDGYLRGDFQGHLYADVAPALTAWQQAGIALYVFSSGSIAAQQLLFGYSVEGDLTSRFSGYFDTRTGAKQQVEAYQAIQNAIALPSAQLLFLSDVVAELDAARAAGWQTCQLLRPGTADSDHQHARAADFHQVSALFALEQRSTA